MKFIHLKTDTPSSNVLSLKGWEKATAWPEYETPALKRLFSFLRNNLKTEERGHRPHQTIMVNVIRKFA